MTAEAEFIDLHCHLAIGIDDGPKEIRDALEMATALAGRGFREAVVTAHIRQGLWENNAETIARAVESLRAANPPLVLHVGAEHMFDELYLTSLAHRSLVTLAGTHRYHLLEFPAASFPRDIKDVVFRIQVAGYAPVFAHPERYPEITRDMKATSEIVANGALLQLDVASLTGAFGTHVRDRARQLLQLGLYRVASSDLHKAMDIDAVAAGIQLLRNQYGDDTVRTLLAENPRRVISGQEVS